MHWDLKGTKKTNVDIKPFGPLEKPLRVVCQSFARGTGHVCVDLVLAGGHCNPWKPRQWARRRLVE